MALVTAQWKIKCPIRTCTTITSVVDQLGDWKVLRVNGSSLCSWGFLFSTEQSSVSQQMLNGKNEGLILKNSHPRKYSIVKQCYDEKIYLTILLLWVQILSLSLTPQHFRWVNEPGVPRGYSSKLWTLKNGRKAGTLLYMTSGQVQRVISPYLKLLARMRHVQVQLGLKPKAQGGYEWYLGLRDLGLLWSFKVVQLRTAYLARPWLSNGLTLAIADVWLVEVLGWLDGKIRETFFTTTAVNKSLV